MSIPLFRVFMSGSAAAKTEMVLNSGYIGQGAKVEEFETKLKAAFQQKNEMITLNSATSALDLAMHMIGIKKGDEVITTPITCTATNSPIVNRHAIPVWSDVDPYTGLIDIEDVARKITKKTKAIIGVNWGGVMPDYAKLKSFGLPVIEDAAHGPYWSDLERGDYIVWSFQAIKHLTCGDGGALVSPDPDRARLLRWYGLDRRSSQNFRCEQNIQEVGYKYHMNDINAAIGLANLPHLNYVVLCSQRNAWYYSDRLETNDKILYVPKYDPKYAYWIYTILVNDPKAFMEFMRERGIDTSPVHARNDKHAGFKKAAKVSYTLPGVDYFDKHQISIPSGFWVREEDREYIVKAIKEYAN